MPRLRPTLLAFAALAALPALADTPAPGCWTGSVSKSGSTIPDFSVQLWLVDTAGHLGGTLHFGSPRACSLEANYKGDAGGGKTSFSLTRPNGGTCTSLTDQTLTVTANGSELAFTVAEQPIQGTLTPNAKSIEVKSCLTQ